MHIYPLLFQSFDLSLELVILIIATIIALVLAITVYLTNPKSATNKIFLILTVFTLIWLVIGYILRHPNFSYPAVFIERLAIFFAAPISSLFFLLSKTLPYEKLQLGKLSFLIVVIATIIMMALNISPYAFVSGEVINGVIHQKPGIGFLPFAVISTTFCVLAIYVLIKRILDSQLQEEKRYLKIVLGGILLMLFSTVSTVLVPIILFQSGLFVPFAPIYALFFFGATAYAIVKHHLFNIKVIATEALIILILILLFAKIITSNSFTEGSVDILIFVATLIFGTLLIRSVRKEVEQREEMERLNKILAEEKARVEELSHFKTQLLSLASHQVKAPLSAIKGFVSLILDGTYGPITDATKLTLGKVKHSADGLVELINTMLDLRKVEEGKMEYQFSEVDIVKIVNDTVEELRPLATAKKLELTFAPPQKEIIATADASKLKQVIQNLIDNAIKYTPTPATEGQIGFVKVDLREGQSDETPPKNITILSVADSGFGIKPQLMPYLFEEFVRDENVKREIRGTGLGLYIARKIVEAHGGRIWAESKGDGQGSTFFVELRRV